MPDSQTTFVMRFLCDRYEGLSSVLWSLYSSVFSKQIGSLSGSPTDDDIGKATQLICGAIKEALSSSEHIIDGEQLFADVWAGIALSFGKNTPKFHGKTTISPKVR